MAIPIPDAKLASFYFLPGSAKVNKTHEELVPGIGIAMLRVMEPH
jgi:hypothetical protein